MQRYLSNIKKKVFPVVLWIYKYGVRTSDFIEGSQLEATFQILSLDFVSARPVSLLGHNVYDQMGLCNCGHLVGNRHLQIH